MNTEFAVINDKGREFAVRIVTKGMAYGYENCLIHNLDEPLVEFYDTTYIENFGPPGQFVTRYFLETLQRANNHCGLCLDGGSQAVWSIDYIAFEHCKRMLARIPSNVTQETTEWLT
jgi:hypothetical protein